jgi:hypothetical protein
MEGSGVVTVQGSLSIQGGGTRDLLGTKELVVAGGGTWGGEWIRMGNSPTLHVPPGASFVQHGSGDAQMSQASSESGRFLVQGIFVKESTGRTIILNVPVDNAGAIDLRAGRLEVSHLRTNFGLINVAAGATLARAFDLGAVVVAANGRLQGSGTVAMPVTVNAGGRLSGGTTIGALTISGDFPVILNADAAAPPMLVVQAQRTGANAATAGRVAVTGTGTFDLANLAGGNRVRLELLGSDLAAGEAYTLTLATAGGGIRRNGVAVGADFTFAPAEYQLTSLNFAEFSGVVLKTTDANTLTLTFIPLTPIPEPALALTAVAAALGALGLRRSRRGR